ncbi:MAG TPA: class I adenylate-forming enzyme family protein [Rhodoblastus sp.]|nr:class I adenylate-forming enzyme family protein [Rhodoblastus sp.]
MTHELPAGWPAVSLARAHELLTAPGAPFEMAEAVIRGHRTRIWKNAPPTLRDVFVAGRAFGDRTFLVHEDERVSFETFARASIALARWLQAQGVRKGDRVAIVMRNLPEWPVAFFGALLTGAIATPLNGWWTGEELLYGLKDSGAKIVIADAERFARIEAHVSECPDIQRIIVTRADKAPAGTIAFEEIIGAPMEWAALPDAPLPDAPLEPDDDASILYTSGTTGNSKGAIQTHRNATCPILAAQFAAARNFIRRGEPLPAPDPSIQRALLLAVPFFHTTGAHAILCPSLMTGTKIVMMRRFDALRAMQLIEREKITSAGGVPTIAWQIIEHPDREKYDLSSLEVVSYGGAPASSELVRRIVEVFPKSAPGIGWGMTETTSTFTSNSAEDYRNRPESAGPCIPVCDMKIVDESGAELPPNATGELWVRGPDVVRGYWNKPEATANAFEGEWLKTGDLARIDEEGFLYIVDRKKDMLIRGGENIYCIEVEEVLYRHPAVVDAAVIGLPHRTLGEEPAAVVTLKPDTFVTQDELRAFVGEHLAAFKVPVRIAISDEPLPRNAPGKIMKSQLRAFFE